MQTISYSICFYEWRKHWDVPMGVKVILSLYDPTLFFAKHILRCCQFLIFMIKYINITYCDYYCDCDYMNFLRLGCYHLFL
jgi:hypothetical protein